MVYNCRQQSIVCHECQSSAKSYAHAHIIRHLPTGRDKREPDYRLGDKPKQAINTSSPHPHRLLRRVVQFDGINGVYRIAFDKEIASIKTHFANAHHALLRKRYVCVDYTVEFNPLREKWRGEGEINNKF